MMTREELIQELKGRDDVLDLLERCIQQEETPHATWLGFEWYDVKASPQTLNYLVRLDLLKVNYKSNKSTHYRVVDLQSLKELTRQVREYEERPVQQETVIPEDLFNVVYLHEDKKSLVKSALKASEPVHVLFIGDISSAKTLFLLELSRLPSSEYILASSLSKAGLYDLMFTKKPKYLIIDELDKLSDYENVSALLSLMETGILSEVKYKRRRQEQFKTWVFAACNSEQKIPPEILSRFGAYRLRFRAYTPEEYLIVAKNVLSDRENVDPELASYIAEQTLYRLSSKDVRVARSIARTAKTKDQVDDIIKLLTQQYK